MRIVNQATRALLDNGRLMKRTMVLAELPSEDFAIWDDVYPRNHDGKTYGAGAGAFTVSALPSVGDMTVQGVEITFSGLDPDILARVEAEPYHQRPIFVRLAILDPETSQIASVKTWFAGVIDTARRVERVGSTSVLTFACESMSRELDRSGRRVRSDADQRELDEHDAFFQHVGSAVSQEIYWGRKGSQRPFGGS